MNPSRPEPNAVPDVASQSARVHRWSAAECPFGIDYSTELMNGLRRRAVEAFHVLPHGGLEIGGILFGRVYPNARAPLRIEIAAERPIECAHHNGPGFDLTEEERLQIAAQLERGRLDPEIAAFSVLGFWVSHSRGELALSNADLETYQLFPKAWQFVLVLKPEGGLPTRATFAFRSGNDIQPHDAKHEFYADASLAPEIARLNLSAAPDKYRPVARDPQISSTGQEAPRPAKTISLSLTAFLVTVAMLVGASLTYSLMQLGHRPTQTKATPTHVIPLNLELFPVRTGFLAHWNAAASVIQNGSGGDLLLKDDKALLKIPLGIEMLRKGFLIYTSQGKNNSATLVITERDGRIVKVNSVLWRADGKTDTAPSL